LCNFLPSSYATWYDREREEVFKMKGSEGERRCTRQQMGEGREKGGRRKGGRRREGEGKRREGEKRMSAGTRHR
jgi:hypothetical protein